MKRSKTGGRREGTPNKTTTEVREAFQELISGNLDSMNEWIEQVANDNPAKALELLLKMSDFILPRLNRVEVDQPDEQKKVNIPIEAWINPEFQKIASQLKLGPTAIEFID